MAKIIKLSQEMVEHIKAEFDNMLATGKFADGKVNFSRNLSSAKRPCTVYYTEIAWQKMQALIRECDKEVGWHGVAYRGENPELDEYTITDILVYPQEVTGATITTDQTRYQTWLMAHDDETFNNIRMQGHSHVNMGVTPSVTDETLYENFLGQLDDTMFYIFLIYNKRGEYTYKIYDMAKNVMFETSDVTVKVIEDELGVEKFLREAKEMVKDRPVTPTYQSAHMYPAYNYGYHSQYQQPVLPKPAETAKEVKAVVEAKPAGKEPDKKKDKKSYKRFTGKSKVTSVRASYYDDDDDWDNPYGPFGYSDGYYYE